MRVKVGLYFSILLLLRRSRRCNLVQVPGILANEEAQNSSPTFSRISALSSIDLLSKPSLSRNLARPDRHASAASLDCGCPWPTAYQSFIVKCLQRATLLVL